MRTEPRPDRRVERHRDDASLGRRALWVLAVIALVIGGWYAYRQVAVEPAPPPEVVQEPVKEVAEAPLIEHPVEPVPQEQPLPPLNESDGLASEELGLLFGQDTLASLFCHGRPGAPDHRDGRQSPAREGGHAPAANEADGQRLRALRRGRRVVPGAGQLRALCALGRDRRGARSRTRWRPST